MPSWCIAIHLSNIRAMARPNRLFAESIPHHIASTRQTSIPKLDQLIVITDHAFVIESSSHNRDRPVVHRTISFRICEQGVPFIPHWTDGGGPSKTRPASRDKPPAKICRPFL